MLIHTQEDMEAVRRLLEIVTHAKNYENLQRIKKKHFQDQYYYTPEHYIDQSQEEEPELTWEEKLEKYCIDFSEFQVINEPFYIELRHDSIYPNGIEVRGYGGKMGGVEVPTLLDDMIRDGWITLPRTKK